ncbi:subtilisin-like protein [Gyrodon lividus]|nr:subtilisin-like protein [Gyrodon lividus]
MDLLCLLYVVLLLTLGISSATLSPWTVHERRSALPRGWVRARKPDPGATIPLRFALRQSNVDDIERYLYDVSHPSSPNYGRHWTAGEVAAKFASSRDSINAVRSWLLESGISPESVRLSPSKGWLEVTVRVEEAEVLLKMEYHVYDHESGTKMVGCEDYSLPVHITPHVDFVTPTIHFDAKVSKRSSTSPVRPVGAPGRGMPRTMENIPFVLDGTGLKNCDQQITPACLQALYGLEYEPVATSRNSYAIDYHYLCQVEYTPQAYNARDLDIFATNLSTGLVGKRPKLVSIDGGIIQTQDVGLQYNGESNLDLEYAMTLVTASQEVTLYQVGDTVEGMVSLVLIFSKPYSYESSNCLREGASSGNFLDALDSMFCTFDGGDDPTFDAPYPDTYPGGYDGKDCGTVTPANVISTSYEYNEAYLSPAYATRQCAEYAKLGLMGVTFVFSSGDYGVAGSGGYCLNGDGTESPFGAIFNPSFPSTCPYVTSIGATQISPGASVTDPENACTEGMSSGGGFSNYFAVPDYQKDVVADYLQNYPPPYANDTWNSTGMSRGYPDLSANGANYVIAVNGSFQIVSGTSASSPVVGAILTMINDARLAQGKSTIGFINPSIYSGNFSSGFNDIRNGTNPGCGTEGFNAAVGWDPVTGLGTPNLPKLLTQWLALP